MLDELEVALWTQHEIQQWFVAWHPIPLNRHHLWAKRRALVRKYCQHENNSYTNICRWCRSGLV